MNKYSSTKKTIILLFLPVILVTGTIAAISSSSFMINAQAQSYYYNDRIDNNYQKSYDGKDNYKPSKDNISINKIKCINTNLNINGNNAGNVSISNKGSAERYLDTYSSGRYYDENDNKQDKGFECIINNNNNNTNIVSVGGGNQTIPPEPTTATLTVKKQVFGCDNIQDIAFLKVMNCQFFQNNSPAWFDCNNSNITNSIFCQSLSESIFDIEVLDDQSTQIQQFEGSTEGTTIYNLEPGTYTVNEIKNATFDALDQLVEFADAEIACVGAGFSDGGRLDNSTFFTAYPRICFEYEDEQGNDCSTITLAAGEQRTCTVKNYIRLSNQG